MKHLLTSLIVLLLSLDILAQCECTDCSVFVPSLTTQTSELDISGANNNTLGANGQQLCKICIELEHDAIDEIDMILTAPDGSSVELISQSGLSSGQDLLFEICFVSCDQSADPDSGHADVFDSSENWGSNANYDGSYYPSSGCLEDLTGDVNGEWEIEITDHIFLDDGTLLDWYLVFTDDSGLDCANGDECDIDLDCIAEGGELNVSPIDLCEGDDELNISIDPSFPNNNEPPTPDFDYNWVIVNADNDIIEDISPDTDLTAYPPGNYLICGLSFFSADESLIPAPDGSLTVEDIEDDIEDELYCADFSDDCFAVIIGQVSLPPDLDGPTELCADEIATFTILDYNSDLNYEITFTGDQSFFDIDDDIIEIAWSSGPAELCATILSGCGNVETCIDVEIIGEIDEYEINGNLNPCPGSIENYTFNPEPQGSETYEVTITGGNILDQTDDSATIEWTDSESTQEICIQLIGGICVAQPFCEEVEIEIDFELPDELDSPLELCQDEVGISEINGNNDIIEYIWTVTNLNIIDGQDFETLEYTSDNLGPATVCLEIITACGLQGPICEDLNILEVPDPMIEEVTPSCEFTFTLVSSADSGNEISWILEGGPGTAEFDQPNEPITDVTVSEAGTYQFQVEEINGICSEAEQLEVIILSELTLSEVTYECNLDNMYIVSFEILNGQEPYIINGNEISGASFTSDPILSEEQFEFVISDDLGCTADIEVEHTCPCVSLAGNMSDDEIQLCIDDELTFIAEWQGDGFFDNNDVGTYFVHDSDDDELGNILDFNDTGEFEYNENYELNVTYYISFVVGNDDGDGYVNLNDPCISITYGQPVIFYDLPNITFEYLLKTCSNEVEINGNYDSDQIDLEWSQVSGPGTSTFSDQNNLPATVEVSAQGIYVYEARLMNQACENSIEIEIEFAIPPSLVNIEENCNDAADAYTIVFEVLGGTPPYTSTLAGIFNGSIFTSDPIPTGTSYSFTVSDGDGCESQEINGNKLCDCLTNAGFMDNTPLFVCVSDGIISVDLPTDAFLDADDLGLFYLHTSDSNELGDIIAFNTDGEFNYENDIILDSIYYISYVVGDNLNNDIDFDDPCLDITSGQPVMWNSIPNVDAGVDLTSCDHDVTISATPSNGMWSIIQAPANADFSNYNLNNSTLNLSLIEEGDYLFGYTATNGTCINIDTMRVQRLASPVINNIQTECSLDLLTYNLNFDIIDTSTVFIVNGEMSTNTYATSNLDVSIESSFAITNSNGCITNITVGPIICDCNSEAGTVIDLEQNLCSSDLINVNISNGDYFIDTGDTLAYILHDGTDTQLGNILAISYGENIAYDSSFEFNTTYYLSVAVANNINNTIDLSDVCLQLSLGLPVVFTEDINVSIDGELVGCINDTVGFSVNSNIYPIDITLVNNLGEEISTTITDENFLVNFPILNTHASWMIQDVNNECLNSTSGTVDVFGTNPVTFELVPNFEICNNEFFGSSINISDVFIGQIPNGEWILNGVALNNDVLEFKDLTPGEYIISYSTVGFNTPCPGMVDDITVTVIECLCPEFNNPDIIICSDNGDILLSDFDTQNLQGTWSVSNISSLPNPPNIVNNLLVINQESSGNFELVYTINDQNNPLECDQKTSFTITIEKYLEAGQQIEFPIFCDDSNEEINLTQLVNSDDTSGQWALNNQNLPNGLIDVSNLDIGISQFTYTLEATNTCQGSALEVTLVKEEVPTLNIISENILCFGSNDGSINIVLENPNGEIIEYYLNNELQANNIFEDLSPGVYQVYALRENCTSDIHEIIIEEPDPISVELGADREIEISSEITIQAIVNILESDLGAISWSDLSGILEVEALELTSIFNNNNTISIVIEDENGCFAEDEINIRVFEPEIILDDIYIPNTFTPGTNDTNSRFGIQNTEQVTLVNSFLIFDRWGNKVYEQKDLLPDEDALEWDGYYNDSEAIQGVYVYMIEVTYITGESELFVGDVTLIR